MRWGGPPALRGGTVGLRRLAALGVALLLALLVAGAPLPHPPSDNGPEPLQAAARTASTPGGATRSLLDDGDPR